jgi:hypothetical protein
MHLLLPLFALFALGVSSSNPSPKQIVKSYSLSLSDNSESNSSNLDARVIKTSHSSSVATSTTDEFDNLFNDYDACHRIYSLDHYNQLLLSETVEYAAAIMDGHVMESGTLEELDAFVEYSTLATSAILRLDSGKYRDVMAKEICESMEKWLKEAMANKAPASFVSVVELNLKLVKSLPINGNF